MPRTYACWQQNNRLSPLERSAQRPQHVLHHPRAAVLVAEVELRVPREAGGRSGPHIRLSPTVDVLARAAARVAAEAGRETVARGHPCDVLARESLAHRPAAAQRALTGGLRPRGGHRIADEVRVLLADEA